MLHMGRCARVFVVSIATLLMEGSATANLASAEPDSAGTDASLPKVAPGDWPWWRGPTLDGKSQDGQVVTTWSRAEHVLWKTKVPGRGHSSPIACAERIFLTTADE